MPLPKHNSILKLPLPNKSLYDLYSQEWAEYIHILHQ